MCMHQTTRKVMIQKTVLCGITAGVRSYNANGVLTSDGCNQTSTIFSQSVVLILVLVKKTSFTMALIKNTFNKPNLIVMLQHTIPQTYPTDSSNINAITQLTSSHELPNAVQFSNNKSIQ